MTRHNSVVAAALSLWVVFRELRLALSLLLAELQVLSQRAGQLAELVHVQQDVLLALVGALLDLVDDVVQRLVVRLQELVHLGRSSLYALADLVQILRVLSDESPQLFVLLVQQELVHHRVDLQVFPELLFAFLTRLFQLLAFE